MAGFATMTVMLLAGIVLVVGALVMGGSILAGRNGARVCPRCGHANTRTAAYCAQCGRRL